MALRGKTPQKSEKRLKALFYGEAGAGKTTAAIQFPRPYLIDTEKGAENDWYVEQLTKRGGQVFPCNDWEEIVKEVRTLVSVKHEFATLIIDPITTIYDDAVDKAENEVGSEFGRHFGKAKKDWKRLGRLLGRLDMNVIVTAHRKAIYGKGLKVDGYTYDGPKGLDYLFDLVFEVNKQSVKDRVGVVKKTRHSKFPEGDSFLFSYAEIAERYGRAVLERDAVAVALATQEQLGELDVLLGKFTDGADKKARLLKGAGVEALDEMTQEYTQRGIDRLKELQLGMAV